MNLVRVALDLPLPRLFDYRAQDASADDVGRRVIVPFGKRERVGVIVEVLDHSAVEQAKLKSVQQILRTTPAATPDWMALARFCSDYYHRPLGEVIFAALPRSLRTRAAPPAQKGPEVFALDAGGRDALAQLPARAKAKRALLQTLAQGDAEAQTLYASFPGARRLLAEMLRLGWVARRAAVQAAPAPRFVAAVELNDAQRRVLADIRAAHGAYGVYLLHGITGSGKTEVYLHLIADVLASGKQALVLVPEINLTPRLTQEFGARFPHTPIVTLHSSLAEGERTHNWLRAQSGEAAIVLGTRLAVFVPLARPGLIVVDEEQDASYKQQDGLRYSARDVAIYRAHHARIPIVLGSATPALETYARALGGRYRLLELAERAVPEAQLPQVRCLDLRAHKLEDGLAPEALDAIGERLARGEQSLIFLNRRGYAPVLMCPACGWVSGCTRCSTRMVLHLADQALRCHHCGAAAPVPRHCPQCGNADIHPFGRGTQRLEANLRARFPQARILRIDRDSTRAKGSFEQMLRDIQGGRADILIGTQILAKGHDFPLLTLVAVLNADSALYAADYRAPERLFAQLVQVAGRSGRAERAGEVLIQTEYPQHALYRALAQHDYPGFARALLAEREQAGFPPYVFEAALRAEAPRLASALDFLRQAVELAGPVPADITRYDPVPMSVMRLAERERAQLLLQSGSRKALQAHLAAWSAQLYALPQRSVRWHLEVDPLEF